MEALLFYNIWGEAIPPRIGKHRRHPTQNTAARRPIPHFRWITPVWILVADYLTDGTSGVTQRIISKAPYPWWGSGSWWVSNQRGSTRVTRQIVGAHKSPVGTWINYITAIYGTFAIYVVVLTVGSAIFWFVLCNTI